MTSELPNGVYEGSCPRFHGYCATGPSGATSIGVLPFPMSVVNVTVAVPSLASSGLDTSNACVVVLAVIAPASVEKLTTVGTPTRLPNRSVRRTVQVIVS